MSSAALFDYYFPPIRNLFSLTVFFSMLFLMGLLYLFPTHAEESDHIQRSSNGELVIKSYGLPWIFWGYLVASLSIIFFLTLAIWAPLLKMLQSEENIDHYLAYLMFSFIPLLSITLVAFFFTEKILIKKDKTLKIIWKIFWLPILKKTVDLKSKESFQLGHFLDSPNMARTHERKDLKAFYNKGYFELFALDSSDKQVLVDRHSLKTELEKMKELLQNH